MASKFQPHVCQLQGLQTLHLENNQLLGNEEFSTVALGISEINCFGFMLWKTLSFTA